MRPPARRKPHPPGAAEVSSSEAGQWTSCPSVGAVRVVVTGGAGFIGSTFVRLLVSGALPGLPAACEVVVVDAMTYAACRAAVPESVEFVEGDVCSADVL